MAQPLSPKETRLPKIIDAVRALQAADQVAGEVGIADSGGYYTGTDVEAALQEAGAAIAAVGGAWFFISAITISDDATAEFDLDISTYSSFRLVLENIATETDSTQMYLRTSTDAGVSFDNGASDYARSHAQSDLHGTANLAGFGDDADTKINIVGSLGNTTNETLSGHIDIIGPGAAKFTHITGHMISEEADGIHTQYFIAGVRLSAADVDAVQLYMSSGNLLTGVIRLYGLVGS